MTQEEKDKQKEEFIKELENRDLTDLEEYIYNLAFNNRIEYDSYVNQIERIIRNSYSIEELLTNLKDKYFTAYVNEEKHFLNVKSILFTNDKHCYNFNFCLTDIKHTLLENKLRNK